MATIITVHGTGATGPEDGARWWQRGSNFEKSFHELVESADGSPVKWRPLIWDGANSLTSRQTAADALLKAMSLLEKAGEPYCVIGHSHGGSIMSRAVCQLAARRREHPALKKMVTVGTPFLAGRPSLLYRLLGGHERYLIISGLTMMTFVWLLTGALIGWSKMFIMPLSMTPLAMGGLVIALTLSNIGQLSEFRARSWQRADARFQSRFVPLWHSSDEAIGALGALKNCRPTIFTPTITETLTAWASTAVNAAMMAGVLWLVAAPGASPIRDQYVQWAIKWGFEGPMIYALAVVACTVVLFSIIPLPFWLGNLAGRVVSSKLNVSAAQAMRANGYGSDIPGITLTGTQPSPQWLKSPWKPLPGAIATAMEERSNVAASQSIARFRKGLVEFAVGDSADARAALAQYLTWDELIHTTYFADATFSRLLCYVIANSEGFRPADAFRNSADFAQLGRWLDDMRPADSASPASA